MGKKNKDSLGRAIMKDIQRRRQKRVEGNTVLHTTEVNDGYDWGRLNLQSVTAESSLQEFLTTAELAQTEFTAEKLNLKYVKFVPISVEAVTSQPHFNEPLTVPRRPTWRPGISVEEQLSRERESFLEWRKHLSKLQEKLGADVTPYERNIELWKQLWRTLEKADLVLILLDARNPLLFRSVDLEKYAEEQKCKCLLLLNKADLTSEYERKCWAEYFSKENVSVIFFSTVKTPDNTKLIEEDDNNIHGNSDTESAESDAEKGDYEVNEKEALKCAEEDIESFKRQLGEINTAVNETAIKLDKIQITLNKVLEDYKLGKAIDINIHENQNIYVDTEKGLDENKAENEGTINSNKEFVNNSYEIYDRDKLLEALKAKKISHLKNPPRLTVGLIGYPNVGKSSTVNLLMQSKKPQSNTNGQDEDGTQQEHKILPSTSILQSEPHNKTEEQAINNTPPRKMLNRPSKFDVNQFEVSVSAVPGHTRHIQSLVLDDDVELLDCPGLVLPAYAVAPDLLLTAVLPIDQMRSHDAAIARLYELVSRRTFIEKYGLFLPSNNSREHDYRQILAAHAYNRGFMTAAGQPDVSRSARVILKDAATGKLQWEQLPPGFSPQCEPSAPENASGVMTKRLPTPREVRMIEGWRDKEAEFDKEFFEKHFSSAHVKGKPIMGMCGQQAADAAISKPWKKEKKHANKNKREKLRRVYAKLDQH